MLELLVLFYVISFLHLLPFLNKVYTILSYSPDNKNLHPPVSVIICAHNELNNLKKLIPALLKQSYNQFEIIIALDRCKDGSYEWIKKIQLKSPKLHLIQIDQLPDRYSGKKYGLTRAIDTAQNEWLLFTDADCIPHSNYWIQTFAHFMQPKTSILLGVSPYYRQPGLINSFVQYETTNTAIKYVSAAISGKPYMGVGRNLAYRRSLFIQNNGFGKFKDLVGGDDDLFIQTHANQVNTIVVLGERSLTYSAAKRTFKSYMIQKTRHLYAGRNYDPKLKIQESYSSMVHLLLWVSFLYLALIYPMQWGVIFTFTLLLITKSFLFNLTARKMGFTYPSIFLPISDLIYGIFYPLLGMIGHFSRKIKWK